MCNEENERISCKNRNKEKSLKKCWVFLARDRKDYTRKEDIEKSKNKERECEKARVKPTENMCSEDCSIGKNKMKSRNIKKYILFPYKAHHVSEKYHMHPYEDIYMQIECILDTPCECKEKQIERNIDENKWDGDRLLWGKRWEREFFEINILFEEKNRWKIEKKEKKKKNKNSLQQVVSKYMSHGDKYRVYAEKEDIH